jgi:hypothetical protein
METLESIESIAQNELLEPVEGSSHYWENQLAEYQKSGLSVSQYCIQNRLDFWKFQYQKRKKLKEKKSSSLEIVAVSSKLSQSVPLKGSMGRIRFWQGEYCIEVEKNFSQELLLELLETLRRQ